MTLFEHVVDYLVERKLMELSSKAANKLLDWMKNNKLLFDNLFPGGKLRVVIPLEVDEIASSILKKIEKAGLKIDFVDGVVSDGRRKIRIGKYILDKKSPFTEEEKNWFVKQGQAIEALREVSELVDGYAIVISRSPLDVVRMSDHETRWTSCHSEGREYFHCAVSEAKYGGPIAYLVDKKDLEGVDLQQPEIFMDSDRGISGIVPLARVRLRRFSNISKNYDLAVPEIRVYGRNVPGFVESVRKWALDSQRSIIGDKRPNMKEFIRRGGHYRDGNFRDADWFNAMFGDNMSSGNVKYDHGGYEGELDEIREKCAEIERRVLVNVEMVSVYWDVSMGEDGPHVSYSAWMIPRIKGKLKPNVFQIHPDKKREIIFDIRDICNRYGVVFIDDIIIQEVSDGVDIVIDFSAGFGENFDGFSNFVHMVSDLDDDRKRIEGEITNAFVNRGLFAADHPIMKALGYDRAIDVWEDTRFENFDWEEESISWYSGPPIIGVGVWLVDRTTGTNGYKIGRYPPIISRFRPDSTGLEQLRGDIKGVNHFVSNLIGEFHKIASDRIKDLLVVRKRQRLLFKDLEDSEEVKPDYTWPLWIEPAVSVYVDFSSRGDIYLHLYFRIGLEDEPEVAKNAIDFISYIDRHFDDFLEVAWNLFEKTVIAENSK